MPGTTQHKPNLLVLVGPTAVGKTKFSIPIARRFHCEIISGDSMQVYRGMDIGTAKATEEERLSVPHHMIDIRNPDEPYSVAEYQRDVKRLISEIHARGRLPFIVGGTGLYIESVCYDFHFSEGGGDENLREEYKRIARTHGNMALYSALQKVDPETAERLHPNDQKRIIRALEVYHITAVPLSEHLKRQKKESPYNLCMIGLTMNREQLYRRIDARVDQMIEQGLIEEVRQLLSKGYTKDLVSMQGLGYKEIIDYLEGKTDLEEAIRLLKRNTRRFAKRQWSWFRHMKEIEWIDVSDESNQSIQLASISDIITRKFHIQPEYTLEQK